MNRADEREYVEYVSARMPVLPAGRVSAQVFGMGIHGLRPTTWTCR